MPVTLPGDVLYLPSASSSSLTSSQHTASASSAIKLGPGLLWPSESAKTAPSPGSDRPVLVTKSGLVGAVNSTAGSTADSAAKKGKQGWWIESSGGSYNPSPSDPVIGQITNRNAEFYTLSISSSHPATLSALAFEGATKRHKPNLKIGALVYGMVIPSSVENGGDMEPEITCVDLTTGKGNGMGELESKEGYCGVVEVSLNLAKSLLHPTHTLLQTLSDHFAFESAIGLNGLVWLRVTEPAQFLAAKMVLEAADSQWLGDTDFALSQSGVSHASLPIEKKVGDAGRKLASQWGALEDKHIRKIVQSCLE